MEWKDNFSELLLLSEQQVVFSFGLDDIYMTLPKIQDTLLNPRIQLAISLVNEEVLTQLQSLYPKILFNNIWELITILLLRENINDEVLFHIGYLLHFCFKEQFHIQDHKLWLNQYILNEALFNRILEIIMIAMGIKDFNEQQKYKIYQSPEMLALEKKIKQIKQQGKHTNTTDIFKQVEKMFMQINYEFGYSFEELFRMNFFHIKILQSYVSKSMQYDVIKRAVANGTTKQKLKYITD